jgi:hypothetical protein
VEILLPDLAAAVDTRHFGKALSTVEPYRPLA